MQPVRVLRASRLQLMSNPAPKEGKEDKGGNECKGGRQGREEGKGIVRIEVSFSGFWCKRNASAVFPVNDDPRTKINLCWRSSNASVATVAARSERKPSLGNPSLDCSHFASSPMPITYLVSYIYLVLSYFSIKLYFSIIIIF